MDNPLRTLNRLQDDISDLKRICKDWPDSETFESEFSGLSLKIEKIRFSYLKLFPFHVTDNWETIIYMKHILSSRVRVTQPDWVVWDYDKSSLVFIRLKTSPNSIQNDLKVTFCWAKKGLINVNCASQTKGFFLEVFSNPEELSEKIEALLRCCQKTSVSIDVNGLYRSNVKRETDTPNDSESGERSETGMTIQVKEESQYENDECSPIDDNDHTITSSRDLRNENPNPALSAYRYPPDNDRKEIDAMKSEVGENLVPTSKPVKSSLKKVQKRRESNKNRDLKEKKKPKYSYAIKNPCRECGQMVELSIGSRHLQETNGIAASECCFCQSAFDSVIALKAHTSSEHKHRTACKLCGVKLASIKGSSHMQQEHGIDKPQCCFCPRAFQEKSHLQRHVKVYHSFRQRDKKICRPCKECNMLLKARGEEEFAHMALEHDKPGECHLCDFKAVLKLKKESNRDFQDWYYASIDSNVEEQVRRHIQSAHSHRTRFRCRYCAAAFPTNPLVKEHQEVCEKKESLIQSTSLCTECGQDVPWLKRYRHAKAHRSEAKRLACPLCPKNYVSSGSLKIHLLRVHYPEKKEFVCQVCHKAFVRPFALAKHMRMHGKPVIRCPRDSCDKSFKWKQGVLQHLMGNDHKLWSL